MLITKEEICFILVDVQEKLIGAIDHHQTIVDNCNWLMQLAEVLSIPLLISEQYPQGLGETTQPLAAFKKYHQVAEKTAFSCGSDSGFMDKLDGCKRQQVVLMGIEAHVCVLQTAFELKNKDYQVFVVADAIGSRYEQDYQIALKRYQQNGIELVSKEMVFFECLRDAKDPQFKELSKHFLVKK